MITVIILHLHVYFILKLISGTIQHDPREDLDLSSHACRSVNISFAVVSSAGPSNFSDVVTLEVFGGD